MILLFRLVIWAPYFAADQLAIERTTFPIYFPIKLPNKMALTFPTKFPIKFPTKFPTKFPINFPTKFSITFPTKSYWKSFFKSSKFSGQV